MLYSLLFIGELFGDFNFILKIFVLLTIISFVKNNLGGGPVGIIVVGIFAYLTFFSNLWAFFGGIYVFYMMLMFGIGGTIIDFFFVGGGGQEAQEAGEMYQTPISSGKDIAMRMRQQQAMQSGPTRPGG